MGRGIGAEDGDERPNRALLKLGLALHDPTLSGKSWGSDLELQLPLCLESEPPPR
jgi:hypothetical protein